VRIARKKQSQKAVLPSEIVTMMSVILLASAPDDHTLHGAVYYSDTTRDVGNFVKHRFRED
jgi:hypothetical protein